MVRSLGQRSRTKSDTQATAVGLWIRELYLRNLAGVLSNQIPHSLCRIVDRIWDSSQQPAIERVPYRRSYESRFRLSTKSSQLDCKCVKGSIGKAARFVDESYRKAFLSANETQVRIAQEKKITQKFYVSKIEVDLAKTTASVSGDRILTIDGFRAVNALSFNLSLRLGERTEQNPEGVYITSEQLVDTSKEVK